MRDHHDRAFTGLGQLAEQREDFAARGGIEVAGRLVAEHGFGVGNECPSDGDALHLAPGHFIREVIAAVGHVHLVEAFAGAKKGAPP